VCMDANDSYLVRVKSFADGAGSFIWELCHGDGLLVLQRSAKAFPTRVEALLDSVRSATSLAPGATQPFSLGYLVARFIDLHSPL
jgi:hypothetical protein